MKDEKGVLGVPTIGRLESEANIWLATTRPDGRPHLVPVWFVWHGERIYLGIEPTSVKGRNVAANPHVSLALEDGSDVVICEGTATPVGRPYPAEVVAGFKAKYDWNVATDTQYTQLLRVTPRKWLIWP